MKYYFKPISVSESIWIFEELVKNGYQFTDFDSDINEYPYVCFNVTRKQCETGSVLTIMDHTEITFDDLIHFNIKKPVFRLDREHIKMVFI